MQPVGGGAPRPGRGHRLPGGLRQLDPVALLMLLVDADRPEPVRSGARELALFLTPEPGAEVGDRGWRWGRRVSGLGGSGPSHPGAGKGGCGLRSPGPEPLASPPHPLAPGAGARGSPLLRRGDAWRHPEMRGRSRRSLLQPTRPPGAQTRVASRGAPSIGRHGEARRARSCLLFARRGPWGDRPRVLPPGRALSPLRSEPRARGLEGGGQAAFVRGSPGALVLLLLRGKIPRL